MISYYDIRAARNAMRSLQNKPLRRRKLDIHYSIPKVHDFCNYSSLVNIIFVILLIPVVAFVCFMLESCFCMFQLTLFLGVFFFGISWYQDNPSEKDINQGTLVIFNLDSSVSTEELHKIFGAYGEIKEVICGWLAFCIKFTVDERQSNL